MFLVKDRRFGMNNFVFTQRDPTNDGFKGEIFPNVTLEYDTMAIHEWPDGQRRPQPQLGIDPENPNCYKVFKYPDELAAAGFELVHSKTPVLVVSWADYRKDYYPEPADFAKSMTQDEWFEFLEEADAAAKIRRQLKQDDEPKPGSSRDEIAEWVAKQHMGADGAVHHIWYLPSGAPEDEIRLMEVSDRFLPDKVPIRPLGFGLEVVGNQFNLAVADVTSAVIELIRQNPVESLPANWSLEGCKIWSRRDLP